MKIYSQVRLGVIPEINAVSTILIAVVTVCVVTASLVTKRRETVRQQAAHLAARIP
jgi:putrescine transport system permease protein